MRKNVLWLCRCHDSIRQGARTVNENTDGADTEWEIAQDVNQGIVMAMSGEYPVVLLGGGLPWRIATINDMAAPANNNLAVEVHCNWSANKQARGASVMAHHNSNESLRAAACVLDALSKHYGCRHADGINPVSLHWQWIDTEYEHKSERQAFCCNTRVPAILVETLFLSNRDDSEVVATRHGRLEFGRAIGAGIINYFRVP